MRDAWQLEKTEQCKTCPFKKHSNPFDILNGYSIERHESLRQTITDDIPVEQQLEDLHKGEPLIIMACHHYHSAHCIGWLYNQINRGNNIRLRMQLMTCKNADQIRLDGEQHETFEDTIPRKNNVSNSRNK